MRSVECRRIRSLARRRAPRVNARDDARQPAPTEGPSRIVGITARYCLARSRRNSSTFLCFALVTKTIIVDLPAAESRRRIAPPGTEIVHSFDDRVAGAHN